MRTSNGSTNDSSHFAMRLLIGNKAYLDDAPNGMHLTYDTGALKFLHRLRRLRGGRRAVDGVNSRAERS
jgi:hypothetical protein